MDWRKAVRVIGQHVFVGGVVRGLVPHIDWPQRGQKSRQHEAPTGSYGDIIGGVSGTCVGTEQPVVVFRNGLTECCRTPNRSVGMILRQHVDVCDPRRCTRHGTHFRLTLAEIAPVGIAVGETQLHRFGDDVDHAHVGYFAECAVTASTRQSIQP